MFGFSGEHLLVLLVILLIFGPRRLPDLGHSIGRTLKNFKDAMNTNELPKPGAAEQGSTARIESQPEAKPAAPSPASAEKETERV
jgi:sec-independent protein translocase protein TatA